MSKHEWEYFDFKNQKRCKRCGIATHAQLKFADAVGCLGSLERAALDRDAMDDAARRPPAMSPDAADAMAYVLHWSYAESRDKSLTEPLPKATDADISAVAGKVGEVSFYENMRIIEREIDKVCGLPAFPKVEMALDSRSEALRQLAESLSKPSVFSRKSLGLPAAPRNHVSDAAWQLIRQWNPSSTPAIVERIEKLGCHLITCDEYDALTANRSERFDTTDFGRYVVDRKTGRKYIAIERYQSVSQVADVLEKEVRGLEARPRVLSRELRERAERAAGRVIAVNFTRAAPDEAIVTHLCEIVERLGGSDVAQLDQENARLRRDLAAMKASRDGWQEQARVWVSTATELRRRLGESGGKDGVTRIEPFPEVKPYDGDWIPPAHRPRIAP